MRIALLCHYFHPEIGAPSARLLALARDFTALGHEVVVVTAFPNHPTGIIPERYRGLWLLREEMEGFTILRNWVYAVPNTGFIKKTIGHLSFMATSVLFGMPRLGKIDVLVASSPTFFAVISAWVIARIKGVPFVFEVRDLWPAVFVELGVLKNRFIIKSLEAVEMFLYRASGAIVTVTKAFERDIVARGIPAEKVLTITNGVDLNEYRPESADPGLRTLVGAEGKAVALYIGAHGISQALTTLLEAARALQNRDDILFLFVGEGAEKTMLEDKAREWRLRNVAFLGAQPREKVVEFYRLADLCFVPLRNIPLFEGFIPSKMFEILACGKPIVASVRGEAARILEASGGARVVAPEDSEAIAATVSSLVDDPALCETLSVSGRAFVEKNYQRRDLARCYSDRLEALGGRP